MSRENLNIALAGIGGYGNLYVDRLIDKENKGLKLSAVMDPYPERCDKLAELKKRKIPLYNDLDSLFSRHKIDLTIISSPIHFHVPQTKTALLNGSHVLCEKPIAPTVAGAEEIISARDKSDKIVAIAYQWSFARPIIELKKDIMSGLFGRPELLKTIVLWPRGKDYYNRSSWAGKIRDNQGRYILDSVANNATAHYLHNMFFVLGESLNKSSCPEKVSAELYRANSIENYDTAVARVITKEDVELLFYVSHAVNELIHPAFCYQFEKATIKYGEFAGIDDGKIKAFFKDGSEKTYDNPENDLFRKLWVTIDAIRKNDKDQITCIPETAISHTKCIETMQSSMSEISNFPDDIVKLDRKKELVYVKGLPEILKECYQKEKMISELDNTDLHIPKV